MGHWDATTLGNDLALDCIAEFVGMKDTAEICDALTDAFRAPTNDDGTYDSPECAWIRAVAELVASGLGRPTRHVTEGVDEWIAVHGDLTAESADDAFEALEIVGRSPYAEQWVRPKSVDVFQSSPSGPLRTAPCRENRSSEAGEDALPRSCRKAPRPGLEGAQRRRHRRASVRRWRASRSIPDARQAWPLEGRICGSSSRSMSRSKSCSTPSGENTPSARAWWPSRCHENTTTRSARSPHLRLYQPGVDVPPGDELERKGLRPRDILNPERTVRLAAERAALLVRAFSPVVFGKYGSLDDLRPISERCDPEEIVRLCPVGTSYVWAAIGWAHDPELGRRYINVRREKLAPFERSEVQVSLEQLDAIEAALEAHYGG